MFKTDWSFKIYLPVNAGPEVHNIVPALLTTYFNGHSKHRDIKGDWKNSKDEIVSEEVVIYEVIVPSTTTEDMIESCFKHIRSCIFKHSNEEELLITKTPIEAIFYERKDYV